VVFFTGHEPLTAGEILVCMRAYAVPSRLFSRSVALLLAALKALKLLPTPDLAT
jgi:hypothetical protein